MTQLRQRPTALLLPVHGLASEVNCSGADVQVISCRHFLVVFHPFVAQLASRLLYNYSVHVSFVQFED